MKKIAVVLVLVTFVFTALPAVSHEDAMGYIQKLQRSAEMLLEREYDYETLEFHPPFEMMIMLFDELGITMYEVHMWDGGAWTDDMTIYPVYEGGHITSLEYTIVDQGVAQIMTVELVWSGGYITQATFSMEYMGMTMPVMRDNLSWTNGDLMVYTSETHNPATQDWTVQTQRDYTYAGGHIVEVLQTDLDFDSGQLGNDYLGTGSYSGDNLVESTWQYWDDHDWINEEHWTYTYSGNVVSTEMVQLWDGSAWYDDARTTHSYGRYEFPTHSLEEIWNGSGWENYSQTNSTLSGNGNPLEIINQDWDGSAWVNSMRTIFGYGTDAGDETVPPVLTSLENYPNPFNPRTTIGFSLSQPSFVELNIYDIRGRLIDTLASGNHDAGNHSVVWHGADAQGNTLPSGVYLYRLTTSSQEITGRAILMK